MEAALNSLAASIADVDAGTIADSAATPALAATPAPAAPPALAASGSAVGKQLVVEQRVLDVYRKPKARADSDPVHFGPSGMSTPWSFYLTTGRPRDVSTKMLLAAVRRREKLLRSVKIKKKCASTSTKIRLANWLDTWEKRQIHGTVGTAGDGAETRSKITVAHYIRLMVIISQVPEVMKAFLARHVPLSRLELDKGKTMSGKALVFYNLAAKAMTNPALKLRMPEMNAEHLAIVKDSVDVEKALAEAAPAAITAMKVKEMMAKAKKEFAPIKANYDRSGNHEVSDTLERSSPLTLQLAVLTIALTIHRRHSTPCPHSKYIYIGVRKLFAHRCGARGASEDSHLLLVLPREG